VNADDHALIKLFARVHEEAPALLDVPERIRDRLALLVADEHAVTALRNLALHRREAVEDVTDQSRAAGERHELALETDEATRRHAVFDAHAAAAVHGHVLHLGAALAEGLHHAALVRFFHVDGERLVGFAGDAVDVLHQNLRA
jgi:hypothetical protein